jgi:foldase protein PrsA
MRRIPATLLCAVALGAAVVIGCGDSDELPEDAVARVGDAVITKADFERARKVASDPADPQDAGSKVRAMNAVIRAEWIRQEAEARGLAVTDAEVQESVDQARKAGFLSEENLKRAGVTLEELLPTIRNGQLEMKVNAQLTERSRTVSAQDIAAYYRRNKAELIVDERRDVRLIVAKTRATADAARAALGEGQSWKVVARRYSVHGASRDNGGKIANLRKGEEQTGLLATIFRAKKGALVGPVKDDRSWAVFTVEKIEPPVEATLEEARDEIEQLLSATRRERALAAFERKYRVKTTCAPGYIVPRCKNGPDGAESGT